ncbi:Uncharacterised protein [Mycobacteroides abscessus subsp. abscessus]|nr:Uncharacterised protein [Mycobacteroides abscessus subsp. abscessus]
MSTHWSAEDEAPRSCPIAESTTLMIDTDSSDMKSGTREMRRIRFCTWVISPPATASTLLHVIVSACDDSPW